MPEQIHSDIRHRIEQAQKVLIASHIRPDGDAIGSVLGLGLALEEAGKNVQMVLMDGIPQNFKFLPGSDQIKRAPDGQADTIIIVDCADLARLGSVLKDHQPDINIDHHITNLNFAHLNHIVPESPSTTAILATHLEDWGLSISKSSASCFLSGLLTDTIGFRTSNVTPDTLRLAAQLIEYGADMGELYNHALVRRSIQSARYWGSGLDQLDCDDRIIWTCLTLENRKKAHYPGNDDADLVNLISAVDGFEIAVVFVEQKHDRVKVSWRSQRSGWDVTKIAVQFNGGGHPAASGADIPGDLDTVKNRVLQATKAFLDGKVIIENQIQNFISGSC